jgi:hypothetical protein
MKYIRVPYLQHSPRFSPKTIINRIIVSTEINQVPLHQLEKVSAIFIYMGCKENIEKGSDSFKNCSGNQPGAHRTAHIGMKPNE